MYAEPTTSGVADGQGKYEVENILKSRIRWRRLEYLVKLIRYIQPDLMDAQDINIFAAIDEFHAKLLGTLSKNGR